MEEKLSLIKEIPVGYKQTEIGVIPKDWEVIPLDHIANIQGGYAFSSEKFLADGKYQVIKMSNLYVGKLDLNRSISFLNEINHNEQNYLIKSDDILITLTGTVGKRDYGYTYRIRDEINLLLNQRVARITSNKKANSIYLEFHFKTNYFFNQFFNISKGGTGNQANVGTSDIEKILIPIPRISEQTAIATVLSDTDALIEKLEKLIAKKKAIKKGAMQQLITGKKRLPGYNSKWKKKTVREIVKIPVSDGPHLTPKFIEIGIPFLSVNNLVDNKISFKGMRYISLEDHEEFSKKCKPQKGDILLGKAASVGLVAVANLDIEFNIWSPIAVIRLQKNYNPYFFYYSLQSKTMIDKMRILTNSSSQGNIGMSDIEKLQFLLPSKIEEQTAIATILSDMDSEIEKLEQMRDKYIMLKQGMMQQLLTGRIRLYANN